MPLLRQKRDLMVIHPKGEQRLRKYDVAFYRRPTGEYVLHRVMKVRRDSYVICGDNRWNREFDVPDEWILGIMTAVIRDGKEISVTDWRYRLYVHLWCDFFWIRALILRIRRKLRKMRRVTRK